MEHSKDYETRDEGAHRHRPRAKTAPAARYVIGPLRRIVHQGRVYNAGDAVPDELVNTPPFAGRCVVSAEWQTRERPLGNE